MKNKEKMSLSKWDKITIAFASLLIIMIVIFAILFTTSNFYFFEFSLLSFVLMLCAMIYYLFCDKLGVRKLFKTLLILIVSICFIFICVSCMSLLFSLI